MQWHVTWKNFIKTYERFIKTQIGTLTYDIINYNRIPYTLQAWKLHLLSYRIDDCYIPY